MAIGTGGRRIVTDFIMFGCHIADRVFMATKAGISRGCAGMTGYAGNDWVETMCEREGVFEG